MNTVHSNVSGQHGRTDDMVDEQDLRRIAAFVAATDEGDTTAAAAACVRGAGDD